MSSVVLYKIFVFGASWSRLKLDVLRLSRRGSVNMAKCYELVGEDLGKLEKYDCAD